MRRSALRPERAARILAEAAVYGDAKAVDRNGVTTQTLRNYRKRMDADPSLVKLFAQYRAQLNAKWANELAPAILDAIDYIRKAVEACKADPVMLKNPDMLHSVNGSMKLLAEVQFGERLLDARLAGTHPNAPAAAGQLVAHEEGSSDQRH